MEASKMSGWNGWRHWTTEGTTHSSTSQGVALGTFICKLLFYHENDMHIVILFHVEGQPPH
jgi:hypothetical protein